MTDEQRKALIKALPPQHGRVLEIIQERVDEIRRKAKEEEELKKILEIRQEVLNMPDKKEDKK